MPPIAVSPISLPLLLPPYPISVPYLSTAASTTIPYLSTAASTTISYLSTAAPAPPLRPLAKPATDAKRRLGGAGRYHAEASPLTIRFEESPNSTAPPSRTLAGPRPDPVRPNPAPDPVRANPAPAADPALKRRASSREGAAQAVRGDAATSRTTARCWC
eukprot:1870070-Rhodomonas_salina.1